MPADKFCEGQAVVPTDCVVDSVALAGSHENLDCSCKPGFLAIFSINGPEVTHVCQPYASGRYREYSLPCVLPGGRKFLVLPLCYSLKSV